ncbi:helix-turn-helix domain-containing protein [Actinoplanes couchii]|uniref:Transcriptional regulator n=1 Tax=Actinoplanes couchii TaxID=403638 RepID=A0ABQ3XS50_9ACTN|nr:helix-turn-helix transcriptional regulator [Actinoplanes couchii]MDR6318765.1 transcriptional regulator with XRE-family HTH domain [Actinoplanes couchii]GID61293.1 transcriptional regulator [Actinoplanes couchii]
MGSASSRSLGAALRKLRTEHDPKLTLDDVAQHMEWSESKVSRIERGLIGIRARDVRDLATFYGCNDRDMVDYMVRLASAGRRHNDWHQYTDVLPRQFATYLGLEPEAQSLLSWEPNFVPGLLQTEAYARELVAVYRKGQGEAEVARRVEARMERQALLRGPDAPQLHAVIGESVLHQIVGDRQVTQDQLAYLLEATRRPNIVVQVLPWAAGAPMPTEGGFQILRLHDAAAGEVVCVDLRSRVQFIDNPIEAGGYRDAWEDVLAKACPPRDSITMIKAAVEELKE